MKPGDTFFIRIDKKVGDKVVDKTTLAEHIEYIKKLAAETELYAGGFAGLPGGMVIFKARDMIEANSLCNNDPVIGGGFYACELQQWELLITSPVDHCEK
ncbi:MAG: YciI family protein [Candidatus Ozemobacteraceae bacterium]